MKAKNQYLQTLISHNGGYHLKRKKERSKILDEYCRVTGQNRKWVMQKIRSGSYIKTMRREKGEEKRIRRSIYDGNVTFFLIKLWNIFDRPCGQRMVSQIKNELDRLFRFGEIRCSVEMEEKLKRISSSEIDRSLKAHKEKEHLKQKYGKKIHPLLYQKIPVRISSDQDRKTFGNIQIDLVEHCGQNASGEYIYTLSTTDLYSNWWVGGAVITKSMNGIVCMLDTLKDQYPFLWKGFHSDNDSAFLNGHLYRYSAREKLLFTRSRPYEKNDNYLVEQKNGRVVRRTVGYIRYDTTEEQRILNELYFLVSEYHNFFQPVMKLKTKKRIGSKIHRSFEEPKTPYQKIMESRMISQDTKQKLRNVYQSLNPAELKRKIEKKQDELYRVYRTKEKRIYSIKKVESFSTTQPSSVIFLNDRTEVVSVR